jgi:hypothetical protein
MLEGSINFSVPFKNESYDYKLEKAEIGLLKNNLKSEASQMISTTKIEELCKGTILERSNAKTKNVTVFYRLSKDLKEIEFCELNETPSLESLQNVVCTDSCIHKQPFFFNLRRSPDRRYR